MSVLKHYIVFGFLFWAAGTKWFENLPETYSVNSIVYWVIGGLFLTAFVMTFYVWRLKRKNKRKNGDAPPIL